MDKEIQKIEETRLVTATALTAEADMRKLIKTYVSKHLVEGTDYYELTIGGRKSKPTLSKSGSEKFMSLFHLRAEFVKDTETWEMLGSQAGFLCYVCRLYTKGGQIVGEGRGARDVKKDGDVNKAIKMAQKSAQIDAILRTGALSDFFTQDLEDKPETVPTVQLEENQSTKITKKAEQDQQRIAIAKLLQAIFKIKVEGKDMEHKVFELTQLEAVPDNFREIVNRLRVVYEEGRTGK